MTPNNQSGACGVACRVAWCMDGGGLCSPSSGKSIYFACKDSTSRSLPSQGPGWARGEAKPPRLTSARWLRGRALVLLAKSSAPTCHDCFLLQRQKKYSSGIKPCFWQERLLQSILVLGGVGILSLLFQSAEILLH